MKFLFIGLLSFTILGCGSAQKAAPVSCAEIAEVTPDHDSLGQKIEDSLNEDTDFFESRFDFVGLVKRVFPNLKPKELDEALAVITKPGTVRRALRSGSYTYLRPAFYKNKTYLFFRVIFEEGNDTFMYFGLEMNEEKSGYISDIFYFNSGDLYSDLMRGLRDLKIGHIAMRKLSANLRRFKSDPEQAIEIWRKVPDSAKEIRSIWAGYVNTLARSSHRVEYEKQFFSYEEKYPTHYSTLFLALDFYQTMKRYQNYYEAVDMIEESFGRDPYLDLLRSGVLYEEKRVEEAYKMIKRSIDEDPTIVETWEHALALSLELKKFTDAREIFETLTEVGYEWDLEVLKTDAEYKEFMNSKEGIKFLKSLEKTPKK